MYQVLYSFSFRFLLVMALPVMAIFYSLHAKADDIPPNILLILIDDQGWSQLEQVMDPRVKDSHSDYLETPNISRLMREGMRFTSGYSPAPLCTPTRRSILCGTSTARSGTEFASPRWIPADHLTIPKALKAANPNYRCAHFGKWGEQMISTPEECGYDASDGMTGNNTGGMPSSLGVNGSHADGPPWFIDNEDPKRTPTISSTAGAFMYEQAKVGKPFYVQTSFYATHLSVVCKEQTLKEFEAKGRPDRGYTPAWAAMMRELDEGIGQLLKTLDELGIADNTYVFLTADNGGRGTIPGGKLNGGELPTNHPLSGAKHHLYEGGIRVPFIVRGPGIDAGSLCHVPVVGYDFLPTFHDLAGGNPKSLNKEVDGVSIAPLFTDPDADLHRPEKALFFHRPLRMMSAVRQGDDKLMVFYDSKGGVKSLELYEVGRDPREIESRDRSTSEPGKTQALFELLNGFLDQVDAEKPDLARFNK